MNRRDIELLSSYLDGQLKPSDSARLEGRLSSDPDLRAVLDDLRSARGLLRQLPMRKAPRNFTLTPKMVGKNPPLPRTYPAFKFVTVLTSLLLFFTLGINFMAAQRAAPVSPMFGFGGGGAPEIEQAPAAAAEPAATEAPAEEPLAAVEPMPTPTLSSEMVPAPTLMPPAAEEDTARAAESPLQKNDAATDGVEEQDQSLNRELTPKVQKPVPPLWQYVLVGIALFGIFIMWVMRRLAVERWRRK